MRLAAFLLVAGLLTLGFAVPSASAAPPSVCQTEEVDATLVKVEVVYGGIGCLDASAERCTLEHDPEYPGHPTWQCHDIL